MRIRKTRASELDEVMEIYAAAREFMAAHGNPTQWGPTRWPPRELVERDIERGKSHVCVTDDGRIAAVFFFDVGEHAEPRYDEIEQGAWIAGGTYGVVHRIASARITRGAATACLAWALEQSGHVRIDTHPDNVPLQNLLQKLGYVKCGIVHVDEDDMPRLAFEKVHR